MLKIDPNPTFSWPVKFNTPEGEQTITLVYKHMDTDARNEWWKAAAESYVAYADKLKAHAKAVEEAKETGGVLPDEPKPERSGLDEVMDIVVGWQDVDGEFSRDAMKKVLKNYHTLSARKIAEAWDAALTEGKAKN